MTGDASREVWEEIYQTGHAQRYPWDMVVSFVFRNAPKDRPRDQVKILEVGFGTGSNLWFAAREGFSVAGVEGSETAVEYARKRFAEEGLQGDLRVGDFTQLPFADEEFDLVIDRAALTYAPIEEQKNALSEIHRVMKKGGYFQYNAYADSHSAYRTGVFDKYGRRANMNDDSLAHTGAIYFVSRKDIDMLFCRGWNILSINRVEKMEMLEFHGEIHSEFVVLAEKG